MVDLKNINDGILSLNENDLLHVILYRNKNFHNIFEYQIYQTIKGLISLICFLTTINTSFILSFIAFLIFLFKKPVLLQLRFLP